MDLTEMMEIHTETINSVTVVEMLGELDSMSAPGVQDEVLLLANPGSKILLDMSRVTYMSSAGLRTLLILYRRINENSGKIILVGLNEDIQDIMAITGFLDFFEIVESRNLGLQALNNNTG
jgi:anti-sigma B factor antagonist